MPRDSQSHPTPALLPMIPLVTGTLVERKKTNTDFQKWGSLMDEEGKGKGIQQVQNIQMSFSIRVQTVPWHHQSTRESTRTEKKAHTNVVGNSVLKRGQRRRFSGRSPLSKKKQNRYSYRGQNKNKFNLSSFTTWWHRSKCDTAESEQKSKSWVGEKCKNKALLLHPLPSSSTVCEHEPPGNRFIKITKSKQVKSQKEVLLCLYSHRIVVNFLS